MRHYSTQLFLAVSPTESKFAADTFLPYSIIEIRILDIYIPTTFYWTNVTKNVEN